MKTWIIPAVALSVLLASPAAIAAPSDQNGPNQQHQQTDKHPNADHAKDKKSDNTRATRSIGNDGASNKGNGNDRTFGRNNDDKRPVVTVKRHIEVDRNVQVKRRVNIIAIRRNLNSPHRYHWNVYHRPSGWYAHRWTYGERLPRAWFVRDYWIGDFIMFGLMMPPDGYVWVRVGDDALLVDTDTGEVVRVEYNVFY